MIKFKCQCGRVLKVKDVGAGKRVRCPGCKQVVQVPTKAEEAAAPGDPSGHVVDRPPDDVDFGIQDFGQEDEQEAGPTKHCPACHVVLPESAVLCTTCGYDFRTGRVYEPPRTLMQKVPWKLVGKWVVQIILLGLVAVAGWFAYKHIREGDRKEQPAEEGEDVGGTSRELEKRGRYREFSIRVTTRTRYQKPRPPKDLQLKAGDGTYTPAEAARRLRRHLASEARGLLKVAGHKVVEPGESSELRLRLDLTIGWVFEERDGKLVPVRPYVAECSPAVVRGKDQVVWPDPPDSARYQAKRPGPAPEASALAGLIQATTDLKLDQAVRQDAAAVIGEVLDPRPDPSFLAKRIARQEREAGGD
ncbi:MAG: hypothetical protein ACOC8D_02835 [bacterium]